MDNFFHRLYQFAIWLPAIGRITTSCGVLIFASCQSDTQLFRVVPAAESGIYFRNDLLLRDTFNILHYMYFFNGGGVASGDINNDGLPDLFFSGNQVPGKLYLNLGGLKFEDITELAGIRTSGWGSGVTFVDINADGWQDLYLCQTGYAKPEKRKNLLYVNQGDLTFREEGMAYGVDDTAYTTQASFFDFDGDGDLDLYLLNHYHQFRGTNAPLPKKTHGESPTTDKLLENKPGPHGHPVFSDISLKAGISYEGQGLGISIADINADDWPDVYISNDFISNDILYLNQGDGTFINIIDSLMAHQSYNGMGNDVADFNNDGYLDIYVADMLPYLNSRRKLMVMNTSEDLFNASLSVGYAAQYTRNTLQLNNGFYPGKKNLLPFSEIGQMAGVHATDWSWSPVFGDLDNDGWKDLFLTNGYYRDITDLDFITYRRHRSSFTSQTTQDSLYFELMQNLPAVKIPNFIFKNEFLLRFSDSTSTWGADIPSLSNGGILVDLDNDGDLDIVTNNLDEEAFLYCNNLSNNRHYVALHLLGPELNPDGIGAKIWLYCKGQIQYLEKSLAHGFMSSINTNLHFGLGKITEIDSIKIIWPDRSSSSLVNPPVDTMLVVHYPETSKKREYLADKIELPIFEEVSARIGLNYVHRENEFQDFKQDRDLLFGLSHEGPAVTTGDINKDGLEDLFIGGAAGWNALIFFQKKDGSFFKEEFPFHPEFEDVDAILFDADQDGDEDLYVVSGGIEFKDSTQYQDRFYRNNGTGEFTFEPEALPRFFSSGSKVAGGDYDRDGDIDLLVCSRIIRGQYGADAPSHLLENDRGIFRDITDLVVPALSTAGMVTASVWADINQDGWMDIILAGDWMPITVYINHQSHFEKKELTTMDSMSTSGWWQSLLVTDLDSDGDMDIVAGNLGLNTTIKISQEQPAILHTDDFDGNGAIETILSYYQPSDELKWIDFPGLERDELLDKLPIWKKIFYDYRTYAYTTTQQLFSHPPKIQKKALLQESVCFINHDGRYKMQVLPVEVQISMVHDILIDDFNADHIPDVLLVGNNFESRVNVGNFDASLGALCLGQGNGTFISVAPAASQFIANGNTRRIVKINRMEDDLYLVVRNNEKLSAFRKIKGPVNIPKSGI